jgi:preprotein translocase subunit YajC
MLLTGVAYAMGGAPGGGSGGAGGLMGLLPILLMFVIFYFLLIRPQQKTARKHQDFIKNLKVGDRVVTTGGLHGEVKGLTDTTVTLEIAEKVRVKVTRSAISGSSQEAAAPEAQKPA